MKTRLITKFNPIGDNDALMHARTESDPITLGSFLRQNNDSLDTAIMVNAGVNGSDGTIAAGSNHGLKVGDTYLDQYRRSRNNTGLTQSALSDTNSGTITGTIYYVKSIDEKLEAFKLATDNTTGVDVTLTAGGLETANSHALSFHQIKPIDAGRFGEPRIGGSCCIYLGNNGRCHKYCIS